MSAKCEPDLLGEGSTDGVICGGSEREEKCHLAHGQNETATTEQRVLVADSISWYGGEAGLEAPLSDLTDKKPSARSSMLSGTVQGVSDLRRIEGRIPP